MFPGQVNETTEDKDCEEPDHQTEDQGPADKAGVPHMLLKESHSKVEEDDAVTDGAEHLDEVVDSGQ